MDKCQITKFRILNVDNVYKLGFKYKDKDICEENMFWFKRLELIISDKEFEYIKSKGVLNKEILPLINDETIHNNFSVEILRLILVLANN